MPKRNIRPKSGKQLYLNKSFLKGMLYTTSEMTEGYVKLISNFDVSPTGDSVLPRRPINGYGSDIIKNKRYLYPVKFNLAVNHQHFISFNNTITEEEYIKYDEGSIINVNNKYRGIELFSRKIDAFNYDSIDGSVDIKGAGSYSFNEQEKEEIKKFYFTDDSANDVNNFSVYLHIGDKEYDITSCTEIHKNVDNIYEIATATNSDGDSGILSFQTFPESFPYRLACINCPEKGEEWHDYGKEILYRLLNNRWESQKITNKCTYNFLGYDNKYERIVIELLLKYKDTDAYININKLMVRLGLANVNYIYNNVSGNTKLIQSLLDLSEEFKINIRNINDYDPFYNYSVNNIYMDNPDYIVQTVRINKSSRPSYNVTNLLDEVKFIYNDYLDAVGFIARIVKPTGYNDTSYEIVYKGPVYIKSKSAKNVEEDTTTGDLYFSYNIPNFELYLPTNNLNGTRVNAIEGSTSGFNLLDKDMIHYNDTKDANQPLSIIGILPTQPYTEEVNIVTQAVPSQEVKLNAVINRGYYYNSSLTSTENYGLDISLTRSLVYTDLRGTIITENLEPIQFRKSTMDNDFTMTSSYTEDYSDKRDINVKLLFSDLRFSKEKIITDYNRTAHTSDGISIGQDGAEINKQTLYRFTTDDDLFDVRAILKLKSHDVENKILKYSITVYHNLNNINKILQYDETLQTYILVERSDTNYQTQFYTKWEIGSENSWRSISPEKLTYYTEGNLVKQYNGVEEDYIWTVDTLNGSAIKFSIVPKIKSTLNDDPNYYLNNFFIENEFQIIESVMPIFPIGTEPKLLNENDIRENIDIKNATRIGIFNRQVFLYGPYTKSNFIQFSKFEEEWYFPFPYYNVELPEDIIYAINYKDSLVIFTKYNIYMLTGSESILECKLHKIYENFTTSITDINLIDKINNYLMFFNSNTCYIMVPNTYSDDPTNIKIYKLSENITNLFNNPENYIRTRCGVSPNEKIINITNSPFSFIENNNIYIVNNYTFIVNNEIKKFVSMAIYNTDYKYWKLYDILNELVESITSNYISEPYLNNQFIATTKGGDKILLIVNNIKSNEYSDKFIGSEGESIYTPISTFIDTGYLSVDTMNEKRFKDIILEFDKLYGESNMYLSCNFYIDGTPIFINDSTALITNTKLEDEIEIECIKNLEILDYEKNTLEPLINFNTGKNFYGVVYSIGTNNKYFASNRTHLRIPLYGKGRLPSFTIEISREEPFELINYSIIYKEKNINIRR